MMIKNVALSILIFACIVSLYSCDSVSDIEDYLTNPYRILRIPPWSNRTEIKKVYKELVNKYHPDKSKIKNKEEAKLKWLEIQKAYEKIKESQRDSEDEAEDPYGDTIKETLTFVG